MRRRRCAVYELLSIHVDSPITMQEKKEEKKKEESESEDDDMGFGLFD